MHIQNNFLLLLCVFLGCALALTTGAAGERQKLSHYAKGDVPSIRGSPGWTVWFLLLPGKSEPDVQTASDMPVQKAHLSLT